MAVLDQWVGLKTGLARHIAWAGPVIQ